jgi:predicted DNA-binding transcriptional regulator YafY
MQASRLLSLALLLQTRGRLTAQQLADELEVSVRTIYRDVESLGAAGVPVYGEPGRAGGYQLVDGYRTRLTGLSGDEAGTLFLTGLPGPAADLGLGPELGAAQLKLLAALPEPQRQRAGRTRQRFHLDPLGWYADAEETPHLAQVAEAVWTEHLLEVHYRRWADPELVTRRLAPYGLVLKAGRWYLVAASGDHVRIYRVSQMLEVTVLVESFERPPTFELDTYWQTYLDDFEARRHRGSASVRVSERGLSALSDPAVRRAARAAAGPPDADGWVTSTIPMESLDHAAGEFLRLGDDIEVLAPADLRARLAGVAERLVRRYASTAP